MNPLNFTMNKFNIHCMQSDKITYQSRTSTLLSKRFENAKPKGLKRNETKYQT